MRDCRKRWERKTSILLKTYRQEKAENQEEAHEIGRLTIEKK